MISMIRKGQGRLQMNLYKNIHSIEEKDLQNLHNLYCQLEEDWTSDINDMIRVYNETKEDSHYKLIGIYNEADELVGTVTLSKCLDLTSRARFYYNLENLVVDEKYRNQGYGKCLLQYAEEYVRSDDGRYINLTSAVKRKQAHEFYYKNGYPRNYTVGFKKNINE